MSDRYWGYDHMPPPEVIDQIAREARLARSEAIAAMLTAPARGIRAGLDQLRRHEPNAPLATSPSGRAR